MTNELATTGAQENFGVGLLGATTFAEAMETAAAISRSELIPTVFRGKPESIVLAWSKGDRLGIGREMALDFIAVVNGKATIYGDGALAIVKQHPECDDVIEIPVNENDWTGRCTVKRKGKEPVVREFTKGDAERAGLWGKAGPWTTHPKRMLLYKARAFALRDSFPDALCGMHIKEELEGEAIIREVTATDVTDKAGIFKTIEEKPKRTRQRKPKADPELKPEDSEAIDTTAEVIPPQGEVQTPPPVAEPEQPAAVEPPAPEAALEPPFAEPAAAKPESKPSAEYLNQMSSLGSKFKPFATNFMQHMGFIGKKESFRDADEGIQNEVLKHWDSFKAAVEKHAARGAIANG